MGTIALFFREICESKERACSYIKWQLHRLCLSGELSLLVFLSIQGPVFILTVLLLELVHWIIGKDLTVVSTWEVAGFVSVFIAGFLSACVFLGIFGCVEDEYYRVSKKTLNPLYKDLRRMAKYLNLVCFPFFLMYISSEIVFRAIDVVDCFVGKISDRLSDKKSKRID